MNKQELIGAVAEAAALDRAVAARAVEATFEAIQASLQAGDEVRLIGFGTFTAMQRKASTGRNPNTGEPMNLKACIAPKFKAGKLLKDACNGAGRFTA